MVRDSSSSQDGENRLNEESSSVSYTAPIQIVASSCSSSSGKNVVKYFMVRTPLDTSDVKSRMDGFIRSQIPSRHSSYCESVKETSFA